MELLQYCTKPSICFACDVLRPHLRHVLAIISHHEITRVTLYTAGHLHTAVPHCSHSRAPIVHTAVPRENNEHGCVYLRCRAVCKLPGCVEGHPWIMNHSTSNPNHDIHQIMTQIISTRTKDRDKNGGFMNFMGFRDMFQIAHKIKTPFLRIIYVYIYIHIHWIEFTHCIRSQMCFCHIKSATVAWDHISFFRTKV